MESMRFLDFPPLPLRRHYLEQFDEYTIGAAKQLHVKLPPVDHKVEWPGRSGGMLCRSQY
jgi:hypothetical protein